MPYSFDGCSLCSATSTGTINGVDFCDECGEEELDTASQDEAVEIAIAIHNARGAGKDTQP